MLARPKFKDHWQVQSDNSQLTVHPNQNQIYAHNQFITKDWCKHYEQFQSLVRYLAAPVVRSTSIMTVSTTQQLEIALAELATDQYVMMMVYNEERLSYKGFISWILIANANSSYLIDALTLRNHMGSLRNILQNQSITKLIYDWYHACTCLKRDFGIFMVNTFNLGCLETQYESLAEMACTEREEFVGELRESPEMIVQRPIKQKLLRIINRNLKLLLEYSSKMPRKPQAASQESMYYEMLQYRYQEYNHPQVVSQPYIHSPILSPTHQELEDLNPRRQKLYYALLEFREHVAKMHDLSAESVLPKTVIRKILENCNISVLEILEIYDGQGSRDKSVVGLDLCKRVYDVIQLNQQICEDFDKIRAEVFEKQLNSQTKKQGGIDSSSIKKLLKDINWGDSSQWLNRKDDPSLKLYKQIISINQFDYSIGEEYSNLMKGDVLKKSEIGKYLKYAQYMRNRNYEKLQNLYKMSLIIKQSKKEDQFSEETEFEKEIATEIKQQKSKIYQRKPEQFRKLFQQQCESSLNLKSSTSLQEKILLKREQPMMSLSKKIKSEQVQHADSAHQIHNIEESSQNTRSRKSSQTSSFNLNELDEICIKRSDIRPLPNSIEQIYQMAQEVKKNADKKIKKKEKKTKNQNKKDVQFVPSWEDIQQLIAYATNLK